MEKINNIKLDRFYVRTRLDCLYGGDSMVDLDDIENLFVQLFDRVEAIEKHLTPTAVTKEGEQ